MRNVLLLILLLTSCSFSPAFDPVVNDKLAQIKVATQTYKSQCFGLKPEIIHQAFVIPALEIETMTEFRNQAKNVNVAIKDIIKITSSFENFSRNHTISVSYCADKLDDISLAIDAILKPYGKLE